MRGQRRGMGMLAFGSDMSDLRYLGTSPQTDPGSTGRVTPMQGEQNDWVRCYELLLGKRQC